MFQSESEVQTAKILQNWTTTFLTIVVPVLFWTEIFKESRLELNCTKFYQAGCWTKICFSLFFILYVAEQNIMPKKVWDMNCTIYIIIEIECKKFFSDYSRFKLIWLYGRALEKHLDFTHHKRYLESQLYAVFYDPKNRQGQKCKIDNIIKNCKCKDSKRNLHYTIWH